jgi:hypothetical protein
MCLGHGRARRGHARLSLRAAKQWMPGTSPGMTVSSGYDSMRLVIE